MLGPRWDGELLPRTKLEARPRDREGSPSGHHPEMRLLDRMNMRRSDAAARGKPRLILNQLTIRFRHRLQEPEPLAVERVFNYRTDDGRRHLTNVFCGVWQKMPEAAIDVATVCNTAHNACRETPRFREFPCAEHDSDLRGRGGARRPGARCPR